MDLNPSQFKGTRYTSASTPDYGWEGNWSVVARGENGPVGSMGVELDHAPALDQARMNDTELWGRRTHEQIEESGSRTDQIQGQQRFSGGNFERRVNKVAWLGVSDKDPRASARTIKGMMGIAQMELRHEGPLHADNTLSQYGARIARSMHQRYGVKGHPENPDMEATFETDEDPARYSRRVAQDIGTNQNSKGLPHQANKTWNQVAEDPDGPPIGTYVTHSPESVAAAGNRLEQHRIKPPKAKKASGQGRLF